MASYCLVGIYRSVGGVIDSLSVEEKILSIIRAGTRDENILDYHIYLCESIVDAVVCDFWRVF